MMYLWFRGLPVLLKQDEIRRLSLGKFIFKSDVPRWRPNGHGDRIFKRHAGELGESQQNIQQTAPASGKKRRASNRHPAILRHLDSADGGVVRPACCPANLTLSDISTERSTPFALIMAVNVDLGR